MIIVQSRKGGAFTEVSTDSNKIQYIVRKRTPKKGMIKSVVIS